MINESGNGKPTSNEPNGKDVREKEGIKLVQIIQIGRRTAMLRLDRERKTTKQNARLRTIPGTKNFHQKLDHFYTLHPEEACLRTRDVVFECVCVLVWKKDCRFFLPAKGGRKSRMFFVRLAVLFFRHLVFYPGIHRSGVLLNRGDVAVCCIFCLVPTPLPFILFSSSLDDVLAEL